jgi:hypothetical protein
MTTTIPSLTLQQCTATNSTHMIYQRIFVTHICVCGLFIAHVTVCIRVCVCLYALMYVGMRVWRQVCLVWRQTLEIRGRELVVQTDLNACMYVCRYGYSKRMRG